MKAKLCSADYDFRVQGCGRKFAPCMPVEYHARSMASAEKMLVSFFIVG